MNAAPRTFEIYEVAELTGLAPARLRAWERRYKVVRPERQANRYRAYSAQQVALLRAFARLIKAGARIGDLAREPVDSVIARADARDRDGTAIGDFLVALERLDRTTMEQIVSRCLAERGLVACCDELVLPLARVVGDRWALGTLPVALEHFASETVVAALKAALIGGAPASGPMVLSACLSGERHEWGLLTTLARARAAGWRLGYLGPDLPLTEIIEASWRVKPALIALSASDPANVERQLRDLSQFVRRTPERTVVIVGGRGFASHSTALRAAGFQLEPAEFPGTEGFVAGSGPELIR